MPSDVNAPDPLHGVSLKRLLQALVNNYGWEGLANRIEINCFHYDPSMNSSLTFLRKTPWARTKVEKLYIAMVTEYPDTKAKP